MYKKIIFFAAVLMIFPSVLFAGEMIQIECNTCNFKSTHLFEGCGMAGIKNSIVFCDNCKNFHTIPTKIEFETDMSKNAALVRQTGRKIFLGFKCLTYPCPKCNSIAYRYKGSTCPLCLKGRLEKRNSGYWD